MDNSDDDLTGWVAAKELAHALGVTPQALSQATSKGRIDTPANAKKVGGRWYYRPEAADQFARSRTREGVGGLGSARAAISNARAESIATGESPELQRSVSEGSELDTAAIQAVRADLRKKIADAEDRELRVAERAGRLMDKAQGTLRMVGLGKQMRQAMQQLSARTRDQLATMDDAFAIGRLLDKEVDSLLTRFIEELERMRREVVDGG